MHRYGIFLWVFKSIAHKWMQWMSEMSSWTWEKKFMYTSNHVLFCLSLNKIALYWLEKSTLLMNGNKRIDNPWITTEQCVGAKAQMEKCVETLQKQSMDVIFNIKKFSVIDLIFTKATEYVTFGFSFRILVFFPL